MLPIFMLPPRDVVIGAVMIVVLGLIAGALPAFNAMNLKITDALEEKLTVNFIRQTFAVTLLNLRTIPQRLGSSGVAIVGIAGVVIVLVSVLSIAQGFAAAMEQSGSDGARAGDAQRRRQRNDQRPRRDRSRHHQAGARACAATARRPSPPPSST